MADTPAAAPPGPARSARRLGLKLPRPRPLGVSLHRQLLLWLLVPQLTLWIAAGFVAYNLTLRYANRAIDASLAQASRALAGQVKPLGNGLFIDFPRAAQAVLEADPANPFYYMVSTPPGSFILGYRTMPPPPPDPDPAFDTPTFYDGVMAIESGDGPAVQRRMRVAAIYLTYGEPGSPQTMLVQVARSSTNREELARHILLDTLLPLSALIVLMSLIVWAGIRAGLAPLARLRVLVEDRAPTDITPIRLEAAPREVRSLAQAVNDLLAAVQQHLSAQKRFLSDAAHQLRTPLAGLKSQTELALQRAAELGDSGDEELRRRLGRVHESATRNAHLLNQLLTLARAEPDSADGPSRARLDLHALGRQLTAELVPRARAAGIDLGFDDEASEAAEVIGIAFLLREALVNLVDNALRYAGRGAVVTVRVQRDGAKALLQVEDDGPGIAPADRERVFERFARATDAGNGCGLGLAIVKEIVERHRGSVTLEPRHPGLTVSVRLPLAPPARPDHTG